MVRSTGGDGTANVEEYRRPLCIGRVYASDVSMHRVSMHRRHGMNTCNRQRHHLSLTYTCIPFRM